MSDPRDGFVRPEGDALPAGDEPTLPAADPGSPAADGLDPPDGPVPPPTAEAELRTFLIADIRGYTTYTTEHGADAAAQLAGEFAAIVREVVTSHDGFLLELRGDEALAVFVLARRALRAALELQTRFRAELPRGVGIGLDAGEAIPVEGGYRGSALNLAARLCGQAGPGETLASEAVIHLAAKVDGIGYADPKTYRLKGMEEPIRAVHVVSAELASKKPIRYGREGGVDRRLLTVGSVALVATVLAVVGLSGAFSGRSPSATPPASIAAASSVASPGASPELFAVSDLPAVAYIDPATGKVTESRRTEALAQWAWFDNGRYMLLRSAPWRVDVTDAKTHEPVASVATPFAYLGGIETVGGTLWVSDNASPKVVGIDMATGIQKADWSLAADGADTSGSSSMTGGPGSLWVGRPNIEELDRLDPATGKVVARIHLQWPEVIRHDGDDIYVTGGGNLFRIDPTTNAVRWQTTIKEFTYLPEIRFGGGFVWTVDDASGKVWKVQPNTGQVVDSYDVGTGALPMAAVGNTMWVGVQDAGKLVGIDMVTGETRDIPIGHSVAGMAASDDELVVTVDKTSEEFIADIQGDVLTIATPFVPLYAPKPDPAVNSSFEFRQAGYITCAGLLRYVDKPAPDGWTLEPEVATALPELSADGRSYTFTVKDGFAFSPPSNEPITAETFKASIERAVSPQMGGFADYSSGFLGDVVGIDAYRSGKDDHISGISTAGDRITFSLAMPSGDFLNRLALPYFCPVPVGTPAVPDGVDPTPPLPAAGPYYLALHVPGELGLFKKNPNYHGDRPQPFDAIALREGYEPGDAIGRVEAGLSDAAVSDAFQPLLNAASARAVQWGPGSAAAGKGDQRWFGGPRFQTRFISLNASKGLLKDPDVRAAIALALDRSRLANVFGIAPTEALLAPSVPGGSAIGDPVPARDVDAAKVLMKGRTGTLTFGVLQEDAHFPELDAIAAEIATELAPIGLTIKVKRYDDPAVDGHKRGSDIDLIEGALDTDYGDPVSLLGRLRDSAWLSPGQSADLDALDPIAGPDRIAAASAFAERVSDSEHLVVPYGYPVYPMYLGSKVGCGFVQPAIGAVDLLSLCRKP